MKNEVYIVGIKHKIKLYKFKGNTIGKFKIRQSLIQLGSTLGTEVKRIVLLHEIIHAIDMYNYGLPRLSEAQVDNICMGLMSVFKENVALTKYLTGIK